MKRGQNVCPEFETRSCPVKNKVTRSNLRKPCVYSMGLILSPILIKRGQNVRLYEIFNAFENGSCQIKTRSLGHTFKKPCVRSRG